MEVQNVGLRKIRSSYSLIIALLFIIFQLTYIWSFFFAFHLGEEENEAENYDEEEDFDENLDEYDDYSDDEDAEQYEAGDLFNNLFNFNRFNFLEFFSFN